MSGHLVAHHLRRQPLGLEATRTGAIFDMEKAMTHTVDVGPHFDALIEDTVASGRYADVSDLMRDALRVWEEHAPRQMTDAEILEAVEESRRMGGEGTPLHEAMDRIRAKLEALR
jgi:antitoxin ParD1/3/4